RKLARAQRVALEAGKAGYSRADEIQAEIEKATPGAWRAGSRACDRHGQRQRPAARGSLCEKWQGLQAGRNSTVGVEGNQSPGCKRHFQAVIHKSQLCASNNCTLVDVL